MNSEIVPVLLACPFCGGDELSHGYSYPPEQGCVQCHNCGGAVIEETEAEAIAAWNRRPSSTAVVSETEVRTLVTALKDARAMLVKEGYLPLGLQSIDALLARAGGR